MKERPILFSAPMIHAILEGRKTQTRRVIRPSRCVRAGGFYNDRWLVRPHPEGGFWATDGGQGMKPLLGCGGGFPCPYGVPGDTLWVRETFVSGTMNGGRDRWVRYRADDPTDLPPDTKWKPSIFMPRWASRITLEVAGVRVEQIQDISESDAIAEGITDPAEIDHLRKMTEAVGLQYCPHKMAYSELWDELNDERGFGWDANPWVFVIEFRVAKQ